MWVKFPMAGAGVGGVVALKKVLTKEVLDATDTSWRKHQK